MNKLQKQIAVNHIRDTYCSRCNQDCLKYPAFFNVTHSLWRDNCWIKEELMKKKCGHWEHYKKEKYE